MSTSKKYSILILGLGLIAISFGSIFVKLCDAPSLVIAMYRLLFSSILYIGITQVKSGKIFGGITRSHFRVMFLSGVFLTIHFATWITSLKFTSVASSVVLVQSAPIFVAVGSIIFLKEKPTKLMLLGILITCSGSIIISAHDFSVDRSSLLGNILAVCGAIGAAGYMLAGRKVRGEIDIFRYVTIVYSITAVLLLIITLIAGDPLTGYNSKIFLLFLAMAVIPQGIGHTTFNWALKYFTATVVSIVILGEPIGASILAYFILGETLTLVKIVGGIVIIIGVGIALLAEKHRRLVNW